MNIVRFLTEADVESLLDMDDALEAVERALIAVEIGHGSNAKRTRTSTGPARLNLLGGTFRDEDGRGMIGAKTYVTGSGGAKFWGMLFDQAGSLLCLYEADRLGQLRTGAASGISARALAAPGARKLAMIGAGYQALTQAEAIVRAVGLEEVAVFGRTYDKAAAMAESLSSKLGINVYPVKRLEAALENADIVATMTNSQQPVLDVCHLRSGVHYVFAGSNNPANAEASPDLLGAIDQVFTDDVEQAKNEGGTLIRATEAGKLSWAEVRTLGSALAGENQCRDASATTGFVSQGVGSWDTALAATLYHRAVSVGVGSMTEINGEPVKGRR
ncbi:ornithine cyclodeaminase family protein [Paeniglutamicibacter sp.]|uniref:ornithine cyclodeaminase family protein n=1 Tax=Paeniglutamicibacter sp. TaxID=1934391 RepID=UPI00398926D1